MGMCLGLCTLSDENIHKLLHEPALIWRVLAPDEPSIYLEAAQKKSQGFLEMLFGKGQNLEDVDIPTLEFIDGEGLTIDLDKAWHGIHYLLTNTAWEGEFPLNFLMSAGEEVGEVDVGYGPARAIEAKDVHQINEKIAEIGDTFLKSRFDAADMMAKDIYPEIWQQQEDGEDPLEYCVEYFNILKNFLVSAAEKNLGVVIYVN